MKKLFPGKKSHKHKDQTQTGGQLHENESIPFADDDIEADNVSEAKPPPFRDKGLTQNDELPNGESHSSLRTQKQTIVSTKTTEANRRIHAGDRITANRDSGISVTSNNSSAEPFSLKSDLHTKYESCVKHPKHEPFTISVTSNNSSAEPFSLKSDLHTKYESCVKHPKHEPFTAVFELSVRHMPENFTTSSWVNLIKLKAADVVRLTVSRTSDARPDELGFRGTTAVRFGTGTAFVHQMDKTELCDCGAGASGHRRSGAFLVMTASHVVFDDMEAKATTVDFFYDSTDISTKVRAWGVRVVSVDVERNRSIVECRTHDLGLCQRLKDAQKERNELIQKELEPIVGNSQMAVLISHPHGMCKQVSFGRMKDKQLVGEVKTKDGMQLADCLITYDTPTCPGSGGGPVNVLGGGMVSFAFAPHCASKGNGENMSGLGWIRLM